MKGYFTFLIVFAAFALLISLAELNLNSKTHNFSSAIKSERFYRVQMNVKEVLIEAARQGALEGFIQYTLVEGHTQAACLNPNTMNLCFNRNDAKRKADEYARNNMETVLVMASGTDKFDDEMDVIVKCNEIEFSPLTCQNAVKTEVEVDALSLYGWRLSSVGLSSDISIVVSSSKNPELSTEVYFPSGVKEVYE